jgi:hypothetical protein
LRGQGRPARGRLAQYAAFTIDVCIQHRAKPQTGKEMNHPPLPAVPVLGVALTCADWRLHRAEVAINARLAKIMNVDGVNLTALPGPDGLLAPERKPDWDAMIRWVKLHIRVHKPVRLAVLAHEHCAAHAVDDATHARDVRATASALKDSTGFPGQVLALLATWNSDIDWGIEELAIY